MVREMRVLNRVITWTDQGLTDEADQRHAEIIIEAMGVKDGRAVTTPSIHEPAEVKQQREKSMELSGNEATQY